MERKVRGAEEEGTGELIRKERRREERKEGEREKGKESERRKRLGEKRDSME